MQAGSVARRRVIYNNDGCDASANGLLEEARNSDDPDRVAAACDPAAHARWRRN
jgi:hypothetical protein